MKECLFIYDGISRAKNLEYRRGAKYHRWENSWSDGTGRRNDPTSEKSEPALRTPSTGVEATPRRARGSSWERECDVPNWYDVKGICRGRNTRRTLRIGERQKAETNADDSN